MCKNNNEVKENGKEYLIRRVKMKNFKTYTVKETKEKEVCVKDDKGKYVKGADGKTKKETVTKEVDKLKYKLEIKLKISELTEKQKKDKSENYKTEEEQVKLLKKINEKCLFKNSITAKDTELVRIIRTLDLENNSEKLNGYTLIKDLISASVKTDVYEQLKEEGGLIKVDGVTFKRLLASSGNVRNKKVTFIREDLYNKAMEILLCGMPVSMEHEQISKYNAYMGLVNSDSKVVTTPRIVVIDDFEKEIKEKFDIVEEIGKDTYKNINNKEETIKIKPFDGAGLVDVEMAWVWAEDLGIYDYIPSSFQFRALAGVKGNLYTFDIKEFALKSDKNIITDAYGNEHFILDKEGNLLIDAILTVSQFKFYKQYKKLKNEKGFEYWKSNFEKELYGYKKTFNITKYGGRLSEIKHQTTLSYQPIQSLKMNQNEIEILCNHTIETIKKISTNVDEFLRFRNVDNDDRVPEYYKALQSNKSLFNDSYIQEKVKDDINKIKENASKGMVFIDANYQTLVPDIVALMEYSLGLEVKGCLNKLEVFNKYWNEKGVKEVDIIRFPHIAMEHQVVNVVENEKAKEWLIYQDDAIVTSIYDTLAEKANSADFDGDRIMSTSSRLIVRIAKEQQQNTILFKPLKKDNNEEGKEEVKIYRINEMDKLIQCDLNGMEASIGKVVNKISILWSMEESEQRNNYIKQMSVIGSLVIDFVKTGVLAEIPTYIDKFIDGVGKPEFMKVKYKKIVQRQKQMNKNAKILGLDKIEKFNSNDCTMNNLYEYVNSQLENIKVDIKEDVEDMNLTKIIDEKIVERYDKYRNFVIKLTELKEEHDKLTQKNSIDTDLFEYDDEKKIQIIDKYNYFYNMCKLELLEICKSKECLVNYMLYAHYCDQNYAVKNKSKDLMWNVCGNDINRKLKGKKTIDKIDYSIIEEKIEDVKTKVKEVKENSNKINISYLTKDNKDIKVKYFANENKEIESINMSDNAKKLFKVIYILNKIHDEVGVEFKLYQFKKGKLGKTHLSKITGINATYIDDVLKELNYLKLITLDLQGDKITLKVIVNKQYNSSVKSTKTINGINQISKIFN